MSESKSNILIKKLFALEEHVASVVESFESVPSTELDRDQRLRIIEASIVTFQRRLTLLLDPDTYTPFESESDSDAESEQDTAEKPKEDEQDDESDSDSDAESEQDAEKPKDEPSSESDSDAESEQDDESSSGSDDSSSDDDSEESKPIVKAKPVKAPPPTPKAKQPAAKAPVKTKPVPKEEAPAPKPKRGLTIYNHFVRAKMAEMRAANPAMPPKECMGAIGVLWKEQKDEFTAEFKKNAAAAAE